MAKLIVKSKNDEILEFYYGERYIATVNHDEHGWAGMDAVESALFAFARLAGIEVKDKR